MALQRKTKPVQGKDSETARKFRTNPLVYLGTFFVLVVVVIAFVFVTPAGLAFGGMGAGGGLTFGYYDRTPISFAPGNFFADMYEMNLRHTQMMRGGELSPGDDLWIWWESFESAAVHTAILRTMERAGYDPPDRVVDRAVASLPRFQENGRFSPALYRQMDETTRISLWRRTREDVIRGRFFDDASTLLLPSAEAEFMGMMSSTERSFEVAVFSAAAFPDSEVEAFARENPEMFRVATLSVITIPEGEDEARRALESVASGAISFDDAARMYSRDEFALLGGDMGQQMAHALRGRLFDVEALDEILALSAGQTSDLVRTFGGWAFFRAEADSRDPDFSDFNDMESARAYVHSFARERMELWAVAQAEAFATVAAEVGFDEAIFLHPGAQRQSVGSAPINFGGVHLFAPLAGGGALAGAASNEAFWTAAFSVPIGSPSRPVVQGDNTLVIFPVSETEAHEAALESTSFAFSSWLSDPWQTEHSLRQHFLNSPRLDRDRFWDAYSLLTGGMIGW